MVILAALATLCLTASAQFTGNGSENNVPDDENVIRGPKVGYRGSVELGYTVGFEENNGHVEFNTVHGYQIIPYVFVGGGVGAHYYHGAEKIAIPIFTAVRSNFMDRKISPFVELRIGYSPYDIKGLYVSPSTGCRFGIKKNLGVNLSLGYTYQDYNSVIGGFSFRVGMDF